MNNKCWRRCPTNSSDENSLQIYPPNEVNELWGTGLWRTISKPLNNSDIVGGVCTEIPRTLKLLENIPSQVLGNPNHKHIPVYLLVFLKAVDSLKIPKNTKQTKPHSQLQRTGGSNRHWYKTEQH